MFQGGRVIQATVSTAAADLQISDAVAGRPINLLVVIIKNVGLSVITGLSSLGASRTNLFRSYTKQINLKSHKWWNARICEVSFSFN